MPDVFENPEKELINNCKKGNILSQERLYKHFYGYAMGIGLRYIFNYEDALEVVNDSFIKAFYSIRSFNEDHAFKPWLRKIIVNTAIDRRRKDLKYSRKSDLEQASNIEISSNIIESLTAQDILKLLDNLPDIQRIVFNLYEIDGYAHEEVAAILNIPASSSRTHLSRAKEKLKKALLLQNNISKERING